MYFSKCHFANHFPENGHLQNAHEAHRPRHLVQGLLCQITRTLKFTPVGACSLALVFSDITGPLVRIKIDEQGNLEEGYGYFQIDKEIRTLGLGSRGIIKG